MRTYQALHIIPLLEAQRRTARKTSLGLSVPGVFAL